ncbi:MAG: hypothetical protein IJ305_06625 [Oscillospiraceae bacterium]|nr:hypothetical protein [Oscillospiraceae bacterium]
MSSTMTKGQKIAKVFFFLAFAPYAIALVFFILVGISDSFGNGLFAAWILSYCMFIFGIIPACIIYQVAYILRKKFLGKIKLRNYIAVVGVIIVLVAGAFLANVFRYEIEHAYMKHSAKAMLKRADEIIAYRDDIRREVFDIEGSYKSVLVDYDKRQVGILYDYSIGEFWKVTLEADNDVLNSIKKKYMVQAVIPLKNQDGKLITFCGNEKNSHRTIAIILECEDGVYCADEIRERDTGFTRFSGLKWSRFFVDENLTADDFDEEWNLITANEEN